MIIKKKGDAAAALGLLAGMAALYSNSLTINDTLNYALGALFFPYVMIGTISLLALILLLQSVDFSAAAAARPDSAARRKSMRVLLTQVGLIALLALYIVVLPHTGYIPTTVVFLIVCMIFLGERKPRKIAVYAVCSVATTAVLYVVFGKMLRLFLP